MLKGNSYSLEPYVIYTSRPFTVTLVGSGAVPAPPNSSTVLVSFPAVTSKINPSWLVCSGASARTTP